MNTFDNTINEWVSIDNEVKRLNEKIRKLREERNDKADNIMDFVKTNRIDSSSIKITDGMLKFSTSRQTPPLTIKHVEECLKKFISNHDQVKTVMDFVKDTRPTKVVSDIKRTYSNN